MRMISLISGSGLKFVDFGLNVENIDSGLKIYLRSNLPKSGQSSPLIYTRL